MTSDQNPFLGRTLYTARPAWQAVDYRTLSKADLEIVQSQWDLAEQDRLQLISVEVARYAQLTAVESGEEPASKALENRLRVAFLGSAGATMQDWVNQRGDILAAATGVRVLDPA